MDVITCPLTSMCNKSRDFTACAPSYTLTWWWTKRIENKHNNKVILHLPQYNSHGLGIQICPICINILTVSLSDLNICILLPFIVSDYFSEFHVHTEASLLMVTVTGPDNVKGRSSLPFSWCKHNYRRSNIQLIDSAISRQNKARSVSSFQISESFWTEVHLHLKAFSKWDIASIISSHIQLAAN